MHLKHTKILRVLTILLALSLAIVSVAGAFLPETYSRDSASMGAPSSIASMALICMVLLTLALAAMVLVLMAKGISEDFTVAIVFGVLSVTSVIFSLLLFRRIVRVTSS